MTTKFDVRVLTKYAIGFVAGLMLFWIFQQLFFSKGKDEPSSRDYKKEYIQSQLTIDRLRRDSLEQRQDLHKKITASEDENKQLKTTLGKLEKHYAKINFKSHTFDELDNIRDSIIANLRKE